MLIKSIIGIFLATVFACQDNHNAKFKHSVTDEKRDIVAKTPNIYAELLDSIEAKYQSVLVLKDKKFPVDSTIEKLKAIGFGSIVGANLHENEKFIVEQANDEFKIIEYYRKTYIDFPFIYDEETRKHQFPEILSFRPRGLRPRGQILLAICMRNNMKIFDAHEFPGTIPKNIAKTLLNFRYENILKKDLFKEWHKKKSQENQYHDYDIRFKILASRSYSKKDSNAIVLFPVKHGYLIVAQWGFEWPQIKAENFTASLTGENITIVLPDSTAPIVLSEGEKAIRSAHDIMTSILFQQTPPDDGQIPYLINTGLYFLSPEDARYIDSLKAKAQEQ